MGYFDAVKAEKATPVALPANVVPIRAQAAGIHPYAEGIRTAWTNRLATLKARPWVQGDGWDDNCFNTARKLIELANSPWAGYSLAEARADYDANAPHNSVWDQREKCWRQAEGKAGAASLPAPPEGETYVLPELTIIDVDPGIEATFWSERPVLTHLHEFARARRVSPWAVLGVALARIVAKTPHQVCLPPTIASKASLNMFVGLVGPSGSGKGAAEAVAADALDVGHIETHTTGSGEGIAHGFRRRVKGEVEWIDDEHAVLFSVSEIDTLAAQGDRKGATLMPELRRAWSGEQLGFGYADPAKRLPVPPHEYRMCLVAGIQPARAAALLNDADGGTPQRFLWMPATDREAPDVPPKEPDAWTWTQPGISHLAVVGGIKIDVCEIARETIITNRLASLRGDGEALDGHLLLCQLKVAAALGILDGRYTVTDDDWRIASLIIRKSTAVRDRVEDTLRAKAAQINDARAEAEASRAVHVSGKLEDAAARRVSAAVMRVLRKESEWLGRGEIRRAMNSRDRPLFDDAIERLIEAGKIEVDSGQGHASAGRFRATEEKK